MIFWFVSLILSSFFGITIYQLKSRDRDFLIYTDLIQSNPTTIQPTTPSSSFAPDKNNINGINQDYTYDNKLTETSDDKATETSDNPGKWCTIV